MSDIKAFIEELGLVVVKAEGRELLCGCPWCASKDSLSVNTQTALWRCFHGCGTGNAWTLAAAMRPGSEKKDVAALLKRHGLWDGKEIRPPAPKKKTWPRIKEADYRPLLAEEASAYCQRKNIDLDAFNALEPKIMRDPPGYILIPGYDPSDMSRPRAFLRDTIDGSPIMMDGKPQKYPLIAKEDPDGTNKSLIGLNVAAKCKDANVVIYAEAWKDTLAALSYKTFVSVANSHGAGSWDDDWLSFFKDKIVYLIFDADETGVRCARRHAERIAIVAKECRIVTLPYDVVPKHGKDLHDYIREDKHTKEEFLALLDTSELIKPPAASEMKQPQAEHQQIVDDYPDTIAIQALIDISSPLKYNIRDGWTVYTNGCYQQRNEETIRCMVSEKMNSYWVQKGKRRERIKATQHNISNVLSQISYMPSVWISENQSAPCSLDGTIQTDCILNLQNGLLDWSVYPYHLMDHSHQYYSMNQLPYKWEGEEDSDMWMKFMADLTSGDEDLAGLLQQFAGYCLVRHSDKKTKFLLVQGESDTGKSVFVDTLAAMLGRENVSNVPLEMFENPHYIYSAYGKLLNISDESEDNILEPAVENTLKNLTGGTMVQFKRLYHDAFSAYPTCKFIISTNHLPKFKDTSEGVWNRMLLVPLANVIPPEQQDVNLKAKLKETEMPGILAWALKGARNLLYNKLTFISPEASQRAMMEYRIATHPEYQFISETFDKTEHESEFISCTEAYDLYKKWSDSNGFGCKNSKNFYVSLYKLCPWVERRRVRRSCDRIYVYANLCLKLDNN
jgi:P4 family phage/plasmid primase-like protien